ncbi:putative FAD-linked oxidase [Gordonia hirsuta DSM 44140 = NBRC 16056]|uniref:Putative FAD-linked oxidase n=1 Tax=Gordonia hirsuta DSM 44140 = NBRC 16056 TaxID=1121927 RepID=L7L748_9ACTN|nr:FAD-binding oxidoreductase [Gordonia hirsuta]GAC56955.1 putative FAD-linked oxidase [Gordonia hirsuta DSM 44140 = NBRC 16056]
MSPLLEELAAIVGPAHVLTAPELVAGQVTDWTGYWTGHTTAVVRPADTAQVAAVLAACHRAGQPVVPQGGNTGLVGGSIPLEGELVLSTLRLNRIEQVDPLGRTLAAGAGVTVAAAQQAAAEHGLLLGTDLASRDSATLGGIVATNAGGVAMVKYGSTRSRVLGVEAALADGRVLTRWIPLVKDNIGYDLPGLLTGSEGTLAVITRVLLRLVVPARHTATVLAGVDSVVTALALRDAVNRAGLTLEAAELLTAAGLDLVCTRQGLRHPFSEPTPYAVLMEVSGPAEVAEILAEALTSVDGLADAALEEGHSARLWHYRESHTETIAASSSTPAVKLDVAVPLGHQEEFLGRLGPLLGERFPTARPICFGHFADGNIHVNVLDVSADERDAVSDAVFTLVRRYGGSISAEHGIGRAKNRWIGLGRSPADRAAMAAIRTALDPAGLLNPAVLRFDTDR